MIVFLPVLFVVSYCNHQGEGSRNENHNFPEALDHLKVPAGILVPDIGSPFILSTPDIYESTGAAQYKTGLMSMKKDQPCITFTTPLKAMTGTASW
jgi:hypothetical protein